MEATMPSALLALLFGRSCCGGSSGQGRLRGNDVSESLLPCNVSKKEVTLFIRVAFLACERRLHRWDWELHIDINITFNRYVPPLEFTFFMPPACLFPLAYFRLGLE